MSENNTIVNPAENTFESNLKNLETLVTSLEQGEISLDQWVSQYSQGIKILETCHKQLKEAKLRIDTLTADKQLEF